MVNENDIVIKTQEIDGYTGHGMGILPNPDPRGLFSDKPMDFFANLFHEIINKRNRLTYGEADDGADVHFGKYCFHTGEDGLSTYLMCPPPDVRFIVTYNSSCYLISQTQKDMVADACQKRINELKMKETEWEDKFAKAKRLTVEYEAYNYTMTRTWKGYRRFSRETVTETKTFDLTDKERERILKEKDDGLHKVIGSHIGRHKFDIKKLKILKRIPKQKSMTASTSAKAKSQEEAESEM